MKPLHAYLLTASLAILFISCQKEPDASILDEPVATCKLTAAYSYDTDGTLLDTSGYVYVGDKIGHIDNYDYFDSIPDSYTTNYEYAGDKIAKRTYIKVGSSRIPGYDKLFYNPDGTLSKLENYFSDPGIPAAFLGSLYELEYSGGKLVKIHYKEVITLSTPIPAPTPYADYTYTYSGNNITRCIEKKLLENKSDTIDYQYDATPNYFAKRGPAFYADPLFSNVTPFSLPLGFSANNVIVFKQSGIPIPITYTFDSKKNLTQVSALGIPIVKYNYQCQ